MKLLLVAVLLQLCPADVAAEQSTAVAAVDPLCRPAACCPAQLPMAVNHNGNSQIKGPAAVSPAAIAAWVAEMKAMRTACQAAIGFDGAAFEVEELKWTQTSYISPQMHPYGPGPARALTNMKRVRKRFPQ
jgi:hypothetical protein